MRKMPSSKSTDPPVVLLGQRGTPARSGASGLAAARTPGPAGLTAAADPSAEHEAKATRPASNRASNACAYSRPARYEDRTNGPDITPAKPSASASSCSCDELLRLDPPLHRVVTHARAQVLGDREQVGAGLVQVAHGGADLVPLLAHAEDEVRLGHQARVPRLRDDVEAALVAEAGPDPAEDPRHRLHVVGEHLGPGVEDLAEQLGHRVEVRRQQLDAGAGVERVDLPDRLGVEPGTAVGQVVAGHAGDGGVAQLHGAHALGHPARLVGSRSSGLPVSIWQKSHRRVHWSPPMRKVASRSSQHSKMLGQPADWQTVCSPSPLTRFISSGTPGPSSPGS